MDTTALVSVIIPTYNRGAILPLAIESALAQTYPNLQVIVVDDGSVDHTAEVVKAYPQVEYYFQKNAGQAAARNCGLLNAKGSIITTLDSDDIWNPDFLTKCVTKLETDNLDFVFANWTQYYPYDDYVSDYLTGDLNIRPYVKQTPDHWVNLTYAEARHLYLICCPSPSSSVVMRRLSIVSKWDENIMIGDDWCMYLDIMLSKECKIAFTLEPLWEKKIDSQNIYDGRKRDEVLRFLYIHDAETMLNRFKHLLTPQEIYTFQKRYMASLVELAKHETLRSHNLKEAVGLLKKSFSADVPYTLKMIPYVIMEGFRRKIHMIKHGS